MHYCFPYSKDNLLSVVHLSLLLECPCILENFTSSDFDFLYYVIAMFVHFHFGIQGHGESQVFEVVNFADHFVVRVGESSLSDPGSLAPLRFAGGGFIKNYDFTFSFPVIYFCSVVLSPVLYHCDHFVKFFHAVSAKT